MDGTKLALSRMSLGSLFEASYFERPAKLVLKDMEGQETSVGPRSLATVYFTVDFGAAASALVMHVRQNVCPSRHAETGASSRLIHMEQVCMSSAPSTSATSMKPMVSE